MRLKTIVAGALIGTLGLGAVAAEQQSVSTDPGLAAAESAVRRALPGTAIESVRPSPIPGLVEVVAGANLLYADTTGRWLVIGHLYDLDTATDVTAERIAATTPRIAWADLPLDAAVRYGAGDLKLAVFSDPDCPWCRKLHSELRALRGVEVYEIMYPLPALHPDAKAKAIAILCAAEPPEALDRVMRGEPAPAESGDVECETRSRAAVERAMAYAERIAVRGTPTLVAPDGRTRSGYLPAEKLEAWLRETRNGRGGRTMNLPAFGAPLLALTLAGCASGPKYACGVPEGVTCQPVSAVYASSSTSSLVRTETGESEATTAEVAAEDSPSVQPARVPGTVVATVQPGEPILTAPRVLRLWIAPWEDAGGDLHDETYLYLRIDDGRWVLTR